ncbi:transposable element Tcb2 transposase [Trichonephila clavipes]|uniref:Transposable element Tcb2 transposase n=1 Tax=Trichonephila clavipes TaxID=2585209 RepID=A0A8X6RXQ8_TRICX|nr:transposable element Tcb2 transposase [Trichonephila clavipes]
MPSRRNKKKFKQRTESEREKIIGLREGGFSYRAMGACGRRNSSTEQLGAGWSTATGVPMSASSIRRRLLHRRLSAKVPLYKILLTANHQRLRLQWAHEHKA